MSENNVKGRKMRSYSFLVAVTTTEDVTSDDVHEAIKLHVGDIEIRVESLGEVNLLENGE